MQSHHLSNAGAMTGLEALLSGLENAAGPTDRRDGDTDPGDASNVEPITNTPAELTPESTADTPVVVDKKAAAAEKKAQREAATAQKKKDAAIASAAKKAAAQKKKDDKAAAKIVADAAKAATPEAPKPPAEPRIFFGRNKLGRLEHRLGVSADNAMLFDIADAELEGADRDAKIAANKADFKKLAVKVQNRATNVIEFVSGKVNRLNPVIEIAVRLLASDRSLVTGDKGNLFTRLSTLYTGGAARAMGNSTMGMLKALEIVREQSKQNFVPNENSALLAMLSSKLHLSFIDRGAEIDHAEAVEAAAIEAARTAAVVVTEQTPTSDNSIMSDLLTGLAGLKQPEPEVATV